MENTNLSSNPRPAEYHNFVPYICTVPVDEWRSACPWVNMQCKVKPAKDGRAVLRNRI